MSTYRPGIDDVYFINRPLGQQYEEYRKTVDHLRAIFPRVLYGGTKGHGFWIAGEVKPSGGDTGNPSFFSIREAMDLLVNRWATACASLDGREPNDSDMERSRAALALK